MSVNDLLYDALIQGKESGSLVKEAALAGGIAERTLYGYCSHGSKTPSVHAVRGAFAVTQHPGLKRLLEAPGWRLVPDVDVPTPQTDCLQTEVDDVIIQTAELMKSMRGMLTGEYSANKAAKVARAISRVETETAEMRRLFEDVTTPEARR